MRALDDTTTSMLHGSAGHAFCCQEHTSVTFTSTSESPQEWDRSLVHF
jgi:hypothetical protein